MPRLREIDDVFFPVAVHSLFAGVGGKQAENLVDIDNRKAIVNMRERKVVGIIGAGYRLVTNEEAVDAAKRCCREVFPETKSEEWIISAVDAPSTAGYCHIDLAHKTSVLDFEFLWVGERPEVPESFGPFIRVTNSYNGQRALSFSIGFYRKVCKNGMIAPDVVIKFSFDHTRNDINQEIEFEIEQGRLGEMKKKFIDSFQVLRDCNISSSYFSQLIMKVLLIEKPDLENSGKRYHEKPKRLEDWANLESTINSLNQKYINEQGENAYALLNSITDLASNSQDNQHIRRDKHSLQKLAGEWMIDFSRQCQRPDFTIESYIAAMDEARGENASRQHPRLRE